METDFASVESPCVYMPMQYTAILQLINSQNKSFSYAKEKEMTLSDFKFIFYMEWGHRLWGRGVGLVFALPALFFLKKGWISKAMKPRLALFAGLIGFQVRTLKKGIW